VIAAEAVLRAKTLLAAAEGRTREAVLEYERAGSEADDLLREHQERHREARRGDFAKLAGDQPTVSLDAVLKHALPRVYAHRPENAWNCLLDYLTASIGEYRSRRGLAVLPVHFAYTSTPAQKAAAVDRGAEASPPACVLVEHSPGYQVDAAEFPYLVDGLRGHHAKNSEALRKRSVRGADKTRKTPIG
jgi:hypothetical protein